MKKILKSISSFMLFVLLGVAPLYASEQSSSEERQEELKEENRILINSRNYGDSIVIRWAPTTAAAWLLCNRSGYIIEQLIQTEDSIFFVPVLDKIFKPLSEEEMIDRFRDEHSHQGLVALHFLYSKEHMYDSSSNKNPLSSFDAQINENNMRFGFSLQAADFDAEVADALGLRWVYYPKDRKDTINFIRIRSLVDTTLMSIRPGLRDIIVERIDSETVPPQFLEVMNKNNERVLSWIKDNSYSGYYIERSTDNKHFTRLNDLPYFRSIVDEEDETLYTAEEIEFESFNDSTSMNEGTTLYYRVIGIDAFACLSEPSQVTEIVVENVSEIIPPQNLKAQEKSYSSVLLTWDRAKDMDKIVGYYVSVSSDFEGPFTRLNTEALAANSDRFLHTGVVPGDVNVYMVAAIDKKGKLFYSDWTMKIITDTIPPAAPVGGKAVIDSTGICLLTWNKNTEPDINSYKVFYTVNENAELLQLTNFPIEENFFIEEIPLNTLTRNIYYHVVAVDKSGNHSEYSSSICASIPDTIPPLCPLMSDYSIKNGAVTISFIPSNSYDVKEHILYRKQGDEDWKEFRKFDLKETQKKQVSITDADIKPNIKYEYAVQATDMAGLKSDLSMPIPILLRKTETEKAEISLQAKIDTKNKQVLLSWKSNDLPEDKNYHFVLYKKENTGNWKTSNSLEASISSDTDGYSSPGTKLSYKISIFRRGVSIGTSKEISLSTPKE